MYSGYRWVTFLLFSVTVKDFMSEWNTDKIAITESLWTLSRNSEVMIFFKSGILVGNTVLKLMLDVESIFEEISSEF